VKRWDEPDAIAIGGATVVSIDPFFGASSERAATLASDSGRPYVTIDCAFDSLLHQRAAATVVSREFRRQRYADVHDDALFARYVDAPGLTIFTAGRDEIRHGRSGRAERRVQPVRVDTVSTLGAGDVFRAGVVYGLFRGFDDDRLVAFASALAAAACQRLPIADFPPTLPEVDALLARTR
jgi:sugar/nucleoside kinase (ribokinase family)